MVSIKKYNDCLLKYLVYLPFLLMVANGGYGWAYINDHVGPCTDTIIWSSINQIGASILAVITYAWMRETEENRMNKY